MLIRISYKRSYFFFCCSDNCRKKWNHKRENKQMEEEEDGLITIGYSSSSNKEDPIFATSSSNKGAEFAERGWVRSDVVGGGVESFIRSQHSRRPRKNRGDQIFWLNNSISQVESECFFSLSRKVDDVEEEEGVGLETSIGFFLSPLARAAAKQCFFFLSLSNTFLKKRKK